MDEDLLKRNTDCVYFLASPLTCKKGVECEYRHHEIARLNPRDCWYWLSGNCLNPTCAFRHPPLDGHAGVPSEPIQSSVPASANKTMVPCYFFFNGFCNKGSRCSFSHKPDDSLLVVKPSKNDTVKPLKNDTVKPLKIDTVKPLKNDTVKPLKNDTVKPLKNDTVKPLKNDNGNIHALNLENKASSGNKTSVVPTPRETHFEQSLYAPKALSDTRLKSTEDLQLLLPENVKQQSVCLEFSSFDYNEAAVTQSDSLVPDNGFAHNMSHSCSEQSSEEQENCHVEPEERWESSPGFDVLVHDESENLGYENGSEYLPLLDMDDHELHEQYAGYEFKNTDEYDTTICSDADILYEQATCDDYRCFDRDFAREREVCGYSREIALDSIFSRKRVRMSAAEMDACDSDLDLRHHLRRRREVNDPPVTGFLRRNDEPSSLMVRNQERHRRGDFVQRQNRRLTSQLGFSSIREVEDLSIANKHRLFRPSQQNRPRKHYREKPAKRPFPSSKVSRQPVVKQQRVIQESSTFSGPKTLAEIKEERKKKAGESSHCEGTSVGFQDPKPLHEILKDRRTMD